VPIRYLDGGLDVGEDTGMPVNLNYNVPFKFPGKINKVMTDLKPMEKTCRSVAGCSNEISLSSGS
jgi:hypothetical protein